MSCSLALIFTCEGISTTNGGFDEGFTFWGFGDFWDMFDFLLKTDGMRRNAVRLVAYREMVRILKMGTGCKWFAFKTTKMFYVKHFYLGG
jgi:hypothetical protein